MKNPFEMLRLADSKGLQIMKGAFHYAGTKRESIPIIRENLPNRRAFVDVYGGSGAVLLNMPEHDLEVFNDVNSGITDFYICLQTRLNELLDLLDLVPHSKEYFVWARDNLKNCDDQMLRAVSWYAVAQQSFGGRAGQSWAKVGRPPGNIASKIRARLPVFPQIHARLRNVQIENLSDHRVFSIYDSPDTIFYCDPPYLNTAATNQYTETSNPNLFGEREHKWLLKEIAEGKGYFMVSGYANQLYDSCDFWTDRIEIKVKEMRGKVAFGGKRTEVLWIKAN